MNSSQLSLQINQSIQQHQYFNQLLKERRIFATPWHWCVHGLGLGQETTDFDLDKATRLVEISLVLSQKTQSTYHQFTHHLLQGIVAICDAISSGDSLAQQQAHKQFTKAIELLPSNSWEYGRACALLTESLVKLGQLELYRQNVYEHLKIALTKVVKLEPTNNKLRYEQLQLLANLFLAVGQAGFSDLLTLKQQDGNTYVDTALEIATTISDAFYRGRGSAIIFSVLGIIGQGEKVYNDSHNHLQNILDIFDAELSHSSSRDSDGVHQGGDFYIFPLSLILNGIAVLGRYDYLTYKRDWIATTMSIFQSLSPASQTSQMMFLLSALDNLGMLNIYIPNVSAFFHRCMTRYLNSTDGSQVDDYLRCTYLIHLACHLGISDRIDPRVWSILLANVSQNLGSERYLESTYGSSYMVTAYALSAFNTIDRLDMLFDEKIGLPNAIAHFQDDAKTTAIHSPRTAFALIEIALRMRPLNSCDTPLFRTWFNGK